MNTNSKRFTRREWLMAILVLMMCEYWIITTSYEYRSSETLISYISFAATIASILLAVIAIIYSFVQADAQQTASATMLTQTESLRTTATDLFASGTIITEQVSRITETTERLHALEQVLDAANQRLQGIEGHITGIKGSQDTVIAAIKSFQSKSPPQTTNSTSPPKKPQDVAYIIFRRTSFDADLFGYMLSIFLKLGKPSKPEFDKILDLLYIAPIAEKLKKDNPSNAQAMAITKAYSILAIARAFGIISYDGDHINIAPEFEETIHEAAKQTQAGEVQWVKEAILIIDEAAAKLKEDKL